MCFINTRYNTIYMESDVVTTPLTSQVGKTAGSLKICFLKAHDDVPRVVLSCG